MQSGASSRAADAIITIVAALCMVLIGSFLVTGIIVGSMSHTRGSQSEISIVRVQTNIVHPDLHNLTEKTSGFFPTPQPTKPTNVTKLFPIAIPLANEAQDQLTLSVGTAGVGGVSALSMFLSWIIPEGTHLGPISLGPKASVLARQNGYTNPTIVLLHGFVEQKGRYAFEQLLPLLSDEFSVLFPDMRGFGSSSRSAVSYNTASQNRRMMNLTNLVLDLRMTLDQVQGYNTEEQRLRSIVLVATDLVSGMIAYQFASQYPQYLKGLVTIQAAHPNVFAKLLVESEEQRQKLFEKNRLLRTLTAINVPMTDKVKQIQENDYALLSDQLDTTVKSKEYFEQHKGRYFGEWSDASVLSGQAMLYTSMFKPKVSRNATVPQNSDQFLSMDFTFADQEYHITVPTLAIFGDAAESKDGILFKKNVEELSTYVSDLARKSFAGASGNILHENAEEVALAIKNFISLVPKQEPTQQ